MKLISQVSRTYNTKEYVKHWVIVPNDLIASLKWKPGDELAAEVRGGKLVIGKGG